MSPPGHLKRLRGFTLTELAVVLVIVGLLIGGMLLPISAQLDIRAASDTERILADVREALIGYAASHTAADGKPYLPCPDTDDDGVENRSGATCSSFEGRIPWVDLGVGRMDAWSNRFRYRVAPAFARKDVGFTLSNTGTLKVCSSSACTSLLASNQPVVVVSHGKNGLGAYNNTAGINPSATSSDELENGNGDDSFVSASQRADFDDLVTWVPTSILFARMITAGRLP